MSALEDAKNVVHAHHSRGMPMGYIAVLQRCENPMCVAIRKATDPDKGEQGVTS